MDEETAAHVPPAVRQPALFEGWPDADEPDGEWRIVNVKAYSYMKRVKKKGTDE